MCVICCSPSGVRQPKETQLRAMWLRNPDGAGYMFARSGEVEIHKGFMTWQDFIRSVRAERFTAADSVVYHFRISTQAGVNPEMTHPFPLCRDRDLLRRLDMFCPLGIAHNGIISLTSDLTEKTFSDTALFISQYMPVLIRKRADITDPHVKTLIWELTRSKWAFLDGSGEISTVGEFINRNGMLFSNENHTRPLPVFNPPPVPDYYSMSCNYTTNENGWR